MLYLALFMAVVSALIVTLQTMSYKKRYHPSDFYYAGAERRRATDFHFAGAERRATMTHVRA
jgi:hypothetical protein